jgi:TolB-like protein/class 3 adenylate cyclase/Tfp pilus assembly protein PilF
MPNDHASSDPVERRLAAIVFSDVVGYSARTQRDETGTLALVRADFERMEELARPLGGNVLNTMGDGMLIAFASAVEAATFALRVQEEFARRRAALPPEQALEHRLGLHVGDVFRQGTRVSGDGVNIAARIQTSAPVGGICVSQVVHDLIRGKVAARIVPMGKFTFKGIDGRLAVFSLLPAGSTRDSAFPFRPRKRTGLAVAAALAAAAALFAFSHFRGRNAALVTEAAPAPAALSPPERSIAVLPFTNMSDDRDSGYFADGVHEDLLTHLARIPELKVISRTSVLQYRNTQKPIGQIGRELGVAYILEGSVRRAGSRIRVTGQLIRADTDLHVWAQAYDGDLTDIFALQAQLATKIADELKATLTQEDNAQLALKPTDNAEAYSLYLRARSMRPEDTEEDNVRQAEIQSLLEHAVALDPAFAAAWTELARTHITAFFNRFGDQAAQLQAAKGAIDRAQVLAPDSPEVHQALGEYYLLCLRDFSNATTQLERVLALVPGSGDANLYLGLVERRQGHWRRAVELFRRARDLDPRNPETGRVLVTTLTWGSRYAEAQTVRAEMIAAQMASLQDRFEYVETSVLLGGHPQDVEAWFAGLSQAERGSEDGTELKREWALNSGDWRRFLTLPHPTDTDPAYFNMEAMVLVALGEPSMNP